MKAYLLLAAWFIDLRWGYLQSFCSLGLVLLAFALCNVAWPSSRLNFTLLKMASLHMLSAPEGTRR